MTNKTNKKICVYGSLRKNHGNWRNLLYNSELLSTEVINIPLRMISMGGFPGLIPSEQNHDITVEVYEVDDQTYRNIEQLEGYPRFYQKTVVSTSLGDYEIYILEDQRYQSGYPEVESGDWNQQLKPRYA